MDVRNLAPRPKGKQVKIPVPARGYQVATQVISQTPAGAPDRVLFSI